MPPARRLCRCILDGQSGPRTKESCDMSEKKEHEKKDAKDATWLSRMFKPETDFFSLLAEQASITLEGMEALEQWIQEGAHDRCQIVRDLEHKADKHKLKLAQHLVGTLITPIDREDIYDL